MAKNGIDKKAKNVLWAQAIVVSRHHLPTLPLRHEQHYHVPYAYVGGVYLSSFGCLSSMVPQGRFYGPCRLGWGFLGWWWHYKTETVPPRVLSQTRESSKEIFNLVQRVPPFWGVICI